MTTKTSTQSHDPFVTKEATYALFERLKRLWLDCGPATNKHDQVRMLVAACIEEDIRQGPRIVGVLGKLGFNRRHVGKMLSVLAGPDPAQHDWWKDCAGDYHLHPNPALEAAAKIVV